MELVVLSGLVWFDFVSTIVWMLVNWIDCDCDWIVIIVVVGSWRYSAHAQRGPRQTALHCEDREN